MQVQNALVSVQMRVIDTLRYITSNEKTSFERLIKAGAKPIDHKKMYFEGERVEIDQNKIMKAFYPRVGVDKINDIISE